MRKNVPIVAEAFVLNDLTSELNIANLSEYIINKLGCELHFYNIAIKKDVEELKKRKIYKLAKRRDAFVYVEDDLDVLRVYVKSGNSVFNTILVMLHEIGHVLLQHLPTCTELNARKQDIEADAFVYFVMRRKELMQSEK